MTLLLPGLYGLINDYILFFIIYTTLWYFISSIKLTQVDLFMDNILIRYPFSFFKKDKEIHYSNVVEFKHHLIFRGPDEFRVTYKDNNNKVKKISFPCNRDKANILMEEIKKIHSDLTYTTHENSLHNME